MVDSITSTLINLDGKSATVAVNVGGWGGPGLLIDGAATGAYMLPDSREHARQILPRVSSMATGGHHLTLVGEVGPELVTLPTGATVTNAAGTRGRLDPMGRGRGRGRGDTHVS